MLCCVDALFCFLLQIMVVKVCVWLRQSITLSSRSYLIFCASYAILLLSLVAVDLPYIMRDCKRIQVLQT